MKNILIILILIFNQSYSQDLRFYKALNTTGVFMYTQVNEDPVVITHGSIQSENTVPNYSKGLQFMQAPGVFSSVDELYEYLTDNNKFSFEENDKKGSYYNKSSSHVNERNSYYNDFVKVYQESLGYTNDQDALQSELWDLIGNVRYQVVFEENYIKDSNYEFLILKIIHPFVSNINIHSAQDINKVTDHFLRVLSDENIKKGIRSYCLVKENGTWKACSSQAVFKHMQEEGYLHLIKSKIESVNFYDVLSTVENNIRKFVLN